MEEGLDIHDMGPGVRAHDRGQGDLREDREVDELVSDIGGAATKGQAGEDRGRQGLRDPVRVCHRRQQRHDGLHDKLGGGHARAGGVLCRADDQRRLRRVLLHRARDEADGAQGVLLHQYGHVLELARLGPRCARIVRWGFLRHLRHLRDGPHSHESDAGVQAGEDLARCQGHALLSRAETHPELRARVHRCTLLEHHDADAGFLRLFYGVCAGSHQRSAEQRARDRLGQPGAVFGLGAGRHAHALLGHHRRGRLVELLSVDRVHRGSELCLLPVLRRLRTSGPAEHPDRHLRGECHEAGSARPRHPGAAEAQGGDPGGGRAPAPLQGHGPRQHGLHPADDIHGAPEEQQAEGALGGLGPRHQGCGAVL
mmetsp:Transcript_35236/g.109739  ORF Transcript_35236/g.109739 Transcript_35236/m.109739 type:complete len:369 (+) Transcript_35236:686-1792(+)